MFFRFNNLFDPELENDVVLYATFNPHTNTIRICGNDGDGVPVSKLSDLKWSDIGDAINTDVLTNETITSFLSCYLCSR